MTKAQMLLARLRNILEERTKFRTHYEGCWLSEDHHECMLQRLIDKVERLIHLAAKVQVCHCACGMAEMRALCTDLLGLYDT